MYHPIIDRLKRIAELLPTAIGGGGIIPIGTKTITITQNGTVTEDVTNYANAEVITNVPQGVFPTGNKRISITQNGTITEDVTQYANAEISVNVPGAIVTDGIVVNARDASGRATNIDFYGTVVEAQQFYNYTKTNGAWIYLETIIFKNVVTEIKNSAFRCCGSLSSLPETIVIINGSGYEQTGVVTLSLPNLTTLQGGSTFASCTSLQSFVAPKISSIQGNYNFNFCTSLQNVQFGSIGYSLTSIPNTTFNQVRQTGITITVYSTGNYADTLVSNIRYGATNATIIIKAAENTTYNNVSYNAGDVIVTSEVTP